MDLEVLDPFGDYSTSGYLRNHFKAKDPATLRRLEGASFQNKVHGVLRDLRRIKSARDLGYGHILEIHRSFFRSVYPWAGQDRAATAPHLAIVKAGYNNLFAHPAHVRRAAEYGLELARDPQYLQRKPGEVFGYLAHSHPFLEGNGRTILTLFADLCRRAQFHVEWHAIPKQDFLRTLTSELLAPGQHLDALLSVYLRSGVLDTRELAARLQSNFNRP
jgi:cell filamentation protein